MRIFVAIFPPPEVQKALAFSRQLVEEESGVRWVRPSNIHLTLKFLGEVPAGSLDGIDASLRRVASRHEPFRVEHRGLGAFPSPKRARILWAGVKEGAAGLSALATDVDDSLVSLGFGREKRRYEPHATLGRARKGSVRLQEDVEVEAPGFVACRLDLAQSKPGAGGAAYTILESHPLGGGS